MTKPLRSPVVGYNHNLRYRGRLFHVQSEDSGPVNPHVFTHLFFEGTILSSKKLQYDAESHEDAVRLSMQKLHKLMIRELTRGEHDPRILAFFASRGQEAYSEPAPLRPAAAAPAPVEGAPSAEIPIEVAPAPAPAPVTPAPAQVIQVTGVLAGSIDSAPARRPAPAAVPPRAKVTPRPVVMVKPTNMKRPPMAFSASADGVVVQRNAVVSVGGPPPGPPAPDPAPRIRPAAVVGDASPVSPPQATAGPPDPSASRSRSLTPGEKGFSDLVSDKSLDDVILEYLSDDNEPERR